MFVQASPARGTPSGRTSGRSWAGALLSCCLAAGSVLARPLEETAPVPAVRMGRWHFTFDGTPDLALTVLFTRSPAGDETRHLIESRGARYAFLSRQDPSGNDSTESIRSVGLGETLSRRLLLGGHQGVAGCRDVKSQDACLLFEGVNGRLVVSLSQLAGDRAAALREKLRALMSASMQKEVLGLSALFTRTIEFSAYSEDFLGVLWPGTFTVRNTRGVRKAGCVFDASFGYPCSEGEKKREAIRFPAPATP